MTISPMECITPSEEDLNTVTDLVAVIDRELKSKFTKLGTYVTVRTVKINAKVESIIVDRYTNAGWKVAVHDDTYYDFRDNTTSGGPYFSFTA